MKKRKNDAEAVASLSTEMTAVQRKLNKASEVWDKARSKANELAQEVKMAFINLYVSEIQVEFSFRPSGVQP